jgi:hypothetical protein
MKFKFAVWTCLAVAGVASLGCSDPKPTNVAEGLPQSEIDAYTKMIQDEEAARLAAMKGTLAEMGEAPAPEKAPADATK